MVKKNMMPAEIPAKVSRKRKAPRIDVGTRNPYALAEMELGVKIDWMTTRPKNAKKLLEKTLKMPYETIFMPGHSSLVHAKLLRRGA
jgi:hypothetical protein